MALSGAGALLPREGRGISLAARTSTWRALLMQMGRRVHHWLTAKLSPKREPNQAAGVAPIFAARLVEASGVNYTVSSGLAG